MSVEPVASTPYSDIEAPDSVSGRVDAAYDEALAGPGVNSPEQQARIAEIQRLEAKGEAMTVSDQLRVLELKMDVSRASGTLTEAEFADLSAQVADARESLKVSMAIGTKDYNQVNDTIAKLENLGVNTAGSPVESKRFTLMDGIIDFGENTNKTADYERQQAESYAEGSKQREYHNTRADMFGQVTTYYNNSGGYTGLQDIKNWENLKLSDFRGVTSENLFAEASFFKNLVDERYKELEAQGLSPEEINGDPLLAYYRMREANAFQSAEKIQKLEQEDPNHPDYVEKPEGTEEEDAPWAVRLLNARMDYVAGVAEADKGYWIAMKKEAQAAEKPDADFINHCDTQIKLYDERVGLLNEAWGKLMDMLTRALMEAGEKAT